MKILFFMNRSPEGLRRERLVSLVLRANLEQVRRLTDASKF